MNNIKTMFSMQSRKAFVAALIATIAALTIASENGFTLTEIFTSVGAFLAAFQATYWTSNTNVDISKEGGYSIVEMAFALLIIVIAVVLILRFIR